MAARAALLPPPPCGEGGGGLGWGTALPLVKEGWGREDRRRVSPPARHRCLPAPRCSRTAIHGSLAIPKTSYALHLARPAPRAARRRFQSRRAIDGRRNRRCNDRGVLACESDSVAPQGGGADATTAFARHQSEPNAWHARDCSSAATRCDRASPRCARCSRTLIGIAHLPTPPPSPYKGEGMRALRARPSCACRRTLASWRSVCRRRTRPSRWWPP